MNNSNNFIYNLLKNIPCVQILKCHNEIICLVACAKLTPVLLFLRDNVNNQFKILSTIIAVDFPNKNLRFEISYELLSLRYNARIRVKTYVNETKSLFSIITIFASSDWLEREVFDLFGIYFIGHHDLRRILTDYGFDGYPLRKNFPLSGFVDVRYDIVKKRIIFDNIELTQQFSNFKFNTTWLN
jgi:NADH dehydrogenase (ubiquinone) Fe-S protein 3